MSNVGILTMKDFNRIRKIVDKGKSSTIINKTENETKGINSKPQLSVYSKDKKEATIYSSKTLSPNDSKHLSSHIPTLSPASKSSLSTSKKSSYKEKPSVVSNKDNKKKPRILPPSLIHDRNKNNKFSKIPFRKVQTFEEESSEKQETKKSSKLNKTNYHEEDEIDISKENNYDEVEKEETIENTYDDNDNNNKFKESVVELENQKRILSSIEQFNTIPFSKENDLFVNDNRDNEQKESNCRNKILTLKMQIDTLRDRRKKELAIFHEKSINQQQNFNDQKTQSLLNADEESIIELKNELLKCQANS